MAKPFILHRGLRKSQEFPNSFEALRDQHGIELEIDVFLIGDQIAVLHNKDSFILDDGATERRVEYMSQKTVEGMTWNKLQTMHVTGTRSGKKGEPVPLLRDYIIESFEQNDILDIELKASTPRRAVKLAEAVIREIHQLRLLGFFSDRPQYPKKHIRLLTSSIEAVQAIQQTDYDLGEHILCSLMWLASPSAAKNDPLAKTVLKRPEWKEAEQRIKKNWTMVGIDIAKELECHAIALHKTVITKDIIDTAHLENIDVYAYVVNHHRQAKRFLSLGVDKIITEAQP